MKKLVNFKVVKCGLFINKSILGCMLAQIFYAHATAAVKVAEKFSVPCAQRTETLIHMF